MFFKPLFVFFSSLCFLIFHLSFVIADPSQCDCEMDLPASQIYIYFQQINQTITNLGDTQDQVAPSGPPQFSDSEKGLFELSKEIDHATHALKNVQGTLDDYNAQQIDLYLHGSAENVVIITKAIKNSKPYSDAQGYTIWENRIMKGLAAQLSILFPELIHHLPPTIYASIGYSISLWVCSMADAIEYLQPGSFSFSGTQFCSDLTPDATYYPDYDQVSSILKLPKCFQDCGSSILAMMVYGYENGLVGLPQTAPWCPDGVGLYSTYWDFTPSDTQWVVQLSISN